MHLKEEKSSDGWILNFKRTKWLLTNLVSYEYLEGYSKLQNPVILDYCSKFKGHEIWKDVLYVLQ